MRHAWILCFVVFAVAVAAVSMQAGADGEDPTVPDVSDLTIKTLETIDLPQSTVQTNIVYFKGAWQRRELCLKFSSAVAAQRNRAAYHNHAV